jgi:flagellar basal body rod protein FlgG
MSNTDGIRNGAAALRYWEVRQQVAANNLANANTHGFRAERVFSRLLDGSVQTASAALDLRPGSITPTERPLDVALDGAGFFVVDTPNGERLTRAGSFGLDGERRLIDAQGNRVQFEDGSPALPTGEIQIDDKGGVSVAGVSVGRLRIEAPAQGSMLFHEAGALLRSDRGTVAVDPAATRLRQGHLEESNVAVLDAMVELIEIQRAYTNVQRTMSLLDGTMDTAVNRLGRIG